MPDNLSRKEFFKKVFCDVAELVHEVMRASDEVKRREETVLDPMWADLSPAMRETEARQLGLESQHLSPEQLLLEFQRRLRDQASPE